MGRRRLYHYGDGRFRRGSLERDFGVRTAVCPACGALNPYTRQPLTAGPFTDPVEVDRWDRPGACGQCGKVLPPDGSLPTLAHVARVMAVGFAESEDTVYCPTCRERRKSLGEAVRRERDETCVWVCSACGASCDDLPF